MQQRPVVFHQNGDGADDDEDYIKRNPRSDHLHLLQLTRSSNSNSNNKKQETEKDYYNYNSNNNNNNNCSISVITNNPILLLSPSSISSRSISYSQLSVDESGSDNNNVNNDDDVQLTESSENTLDHLSILNTHDDTSSQYDGNETSASLLIPPTVLAFNNNDKVQSVSSTTTIENKSQQLSSYCPHDRDNGPSTTFSSNKSSPSHQCPFSASSFHQFFKQLDFRQSPSKCPFADHFSIPHIGGASSEQSSTSNTWLMDKVLPSSSSPIQHSSTSPVPSIQVNNTLHPNACSSLFTHRINPLTRNKRSIDLTSPTVQSSSSSVSSNRSSHSSCRSSSITSCSISSPSSRSTSGCPFIQMMHGRWRSFGIAISILMCCIVVLIIIIQSMAFIHSILEFATQSLLNLGRTGVVARHPILSALASFSILFCLLFLGVPLTPLEIVNGFLFGYWGLLISLPAKIVGSIVFYRIANSPVYGTCLRSKLEKYKAFQLFASIIHESPVKYSLLLRFAALPMLLKNYTLIILKVPFIVYTLTLIISAIPYSILSCSMGSMTQSALDISMGPPPPPPIMGLGGHHGFRHPDFLAAPLRGQPPSQPSEFIGPPHHPFMHHGPNGPHHPPPQKPLLMLILQFIAISLTVMLPLIFIRAYLKKLEESHEGQLMVRCSSSSTTKLQREIDLEDKHDDIDGEESSSSVPNTNTNHPSGDESPNLIYRSSRGNGNNSRECVSPTLSAQCSGVGQGLNSSSIPHVAINSVNEIALVGFDCLRDHDHQ